MAGLEFREVLESKRMEIIAGLNLEKMYLVEYLRSKRVFDEEDCELILSVNTKNGKAGKLVDFMLRKGPDEYQHFLDVIQLENSALYESLTGMKSTSKPSPLMKHFACPGLKFDAVSDFELKLFADHQQRLYRDLHEISQKYNQLVTVKHQLEERLLKADKDLEFEKERSQAFERRLSLENKTDDDQFADNEVILFQECDEMQKGIADRDVYIIMLQMKLLAEKEECEKLRSKVSELEDKTDNMARELRRVSENYNHERCQSLKLSECIRLQVDEIQKMDELKKRLRESQFQNILMREERDCIKNELKELQKWAEALKTRFDVVEREKIDCQEKTEFVTNNCANLQESVRALQRQMSYSQLEVEEIKKRNEILTKDSEIYKKQRDCSLEARKEAILERDQAVSEKNSIAKQFNELQEKRDRMNEDRVQLLQEYDTLKIKYKTTLDELSQVKRKLHEKELEAGDLFRQFNEVQEKNRRSSRLAELNTGSKPPERKDGEMHSETGTVSSEQTTEVEDVEGEYPWRDRKLKALLNSMKLRISGPRGEDGLPKHPVSPVSENMTLQLIHCLLPNLSSRPYSTAENAHSLQRRLAIKQKKESGETLQVKVQSKASSLPCFAQRNADRSGLPSGKENRISMSTSSPDLVSSCKPGLSPLSQDINTLPKSFRDRTTNVVTQRERSKSNTN